MTTDTRILMRLQRGPATIDRLTEALGVSRTAVQRAMLRLVAAGEVVPAGPAPRRGSSQAQVWGLASDVVAPPAPAAAEAAPPEPPVPNAPMHQRAIAARPALHAWWVQQGAAA